MYKRYFKNNFVKKEIIKLILKNELRFENI